MKTKHTLAALFVFGMLFASCTNKEKPLKEYMTDAWETKYMKIEMPTFSKSDSTHVFEDKFENNPARRVQSVYKSDGTFYTWSLNRKGERHGNSSGTWDIKGDSLFIEFFYDGRNVKEAYHVEKIKDGFKGISKYDWDKDGEFDDLLTMKTKRIVLGE
ncbi:hypothetical protein RQM59_03980 [Flavobacteriaceae bacterium S356]|uniref:Uncharacterized protein n=1 Tax=Asprobacillus argus TaxID=3076534 RepID=A0ABU3LCX5_9FLAO|nr:hypothetical protein [Flavobacteriaceae bacterium S356]